MSALSKLLKGADKNRDSIHAAWLAEVQAIADRYQVEIATGQLSDVWQVSQPGQDEWFLEYDAPEDERLRLALEALSMLDEKVSPYGVGPSNMERFKPNPPANEYHAQAERFLTDNRINFRATLSDSKTPPWNDDHGGHHYRVTLSRPNSVITKRTPTNSFNGPKRIVFDFWGSIAEAERGQTEIHAYDVLACISGDIHCPETFEDYCSEYGDSIDSISAKQTFNRVSRFARRLRAFFTEQEVEQLQEIQ